MRGNALRPLAVVGTLLGALACQADVDGPAPTDSTPIQVELIAETLAGLGSCTNARAGTVGYVTSTSRLYACANRQWNLIPCTNTDAGKVAYESTTQTLLACEMRRWTPIATPQGEPGSDGLSSLLAQSDEPAGANCSAGGVRIDTGVDDDADGVLDPREIDQTSYVCNGTSSGEAGSGGAAGGGEAGSGGAGGGSADPVIPAIDGDCPVFQNGTINFNGLSGVLMKVGPMAASGGSLIFYWHGTGSLASEFERMIPAAAQQSILDAGGIIVSPQTSTGLGADCSGTGIFSQGDFDVADQIAACAVRDHNIDPRRIYTMGCSAGGLQAGCMAKLRSSYIAAVAPNSGGQVFPLMQQDPTRTPASMTMHGSSGADVVVIDFAAASLAYADSIKAAGGFAIDCDHGGGHCAAPAPLQTAAIQFLLDHPFGVTPKPYAGGLPASFPSYCAAR